MHVHKLHASDLRGAVAVVISGLLSDATQGRRRCTPAMACLSTAVVVQEQQAVLGLFRRLRLTKDQQQAAAEAWRAWIRTRESLDRALRTALQPLDGLLALPNLVLDSAPPPEDHPLAISSIRTSGWDVCMDASPSPPPPRSSNGRGTLPPLHPQEAGSTNNGSPSPGRRTADECGAGVCICADCAETLTAGLLGVDSGATDTASRAAAAAAEVHRQEGMAAAEQLRAIGMPGALFTVDQFSRQMAFVLSHGGLTDWVSICKIAAEELQQGELVEGLEQCCSLI